VALSLSITRPRARGSDLRETPIVLAIRSAQPSVVSISGEKTIASKPNSEVGHADDSRRVNGMGTGVVIDPRGYIITNHHVVNGVRKIQVSLADGEESAAKLVQWDEATDLAIIKIESSEPLPVINIGKSSDLMLGETVVAIGNAYGYPGSNTMGIISELHRPVQVSDAQFYNDLIQTDASINPGNSGGPLLNIDGEMIGINVAVRAGAQGIGFAIPVDQVLQVAAQLLAVTGKETAWHGLNLSDTEEEGEAVVASVTEGSPADESGLLPGDVVTEVDDIAIGRIVDFHCAMLERSPGERITLMVDRDEESVLVEMELAGAPTVTRQAKTGNDAWSLLGVKLKPIPEDEFNERFQTMYRGGLTVTELRPRSPAESRGILSGDVLVGIHIYETITLNHVSYILRQPDFKEHDPLRFLILRDGRLYEGFLPIGK
jgi:serine protease Do